MPRRPHCLSARSCAPAARRGLTQEALAERAGVSPREVQALERGETRPQRETAARLAAALDLRASWLAAFQAAAQPAPRRRGRQEATGPVAGGASRHNLPASWRPTGRSTGPGSALRQRWPSTGGSGTSRAWPGRSANSASLRLMAALVRGDLAARLDAVSEAVIAQVNANPPQHRKSACRQILEMLRANGEPTIGFTLGDTVARIPCR